jgi:hypothetical protein
MTGAQRKIYINMSIQEWDNFNSLVCTLILIFIVPRMGVAQAKFFNIWKENAGRILSNQQKILEGEVIEEDKEGVEYFFNQDANPYDLQDENSRVNVCMMLFQQ